LVADAAGEPMRDEATGQLLTVWVEEPIDATTSAIELLKSVGAIGGERPAPPPTAREIAEALKDALPQPREQDPEVSALRKDFQEYLHRQEKKDAQEEAARQAVNETMGRMQPYLDELKDLKGRSGLTDHQYELRHQETLQGNLLGTMREGFAGIRGDLQPFMLQMMVTSLKAAGLTDNTIGDLLQRMQQPNGHALKPGAEEAAETMRKWVKES
jgi:hypothetical protein